ncbi:PaaI family thioesterase [Epibacterium sp. Ofav1-8]|uniref:PaaI family thioesterase n=1 Tax=Epibacterium sp. Ofav1-8 TaxID=2917735 RepID=UPI001EF67B97|nr:PaaI family thioesterase [Epibacterium sp. Ofav1-8]MCG7623123.1 PaaI family thioesterase [Epibacterium sp. Ofav1-8]
MTKDDLQQILADAFAPWVQALELTVVETAPDSTVLRMPVTPALARVGGIVSGQALMALADTAMVLGAMSHAGRMLPLATTDLHCQFLRPGNGAAILCRAQLVKPGRALSVWRAEMTDEASGKLVATATATFYLPA